MDNFNEINSINNVNANQIVSNTPSSTPRRFNSLFYLIPIIIIIIGGVVLWRLNFQENTSPFSVLEGTDESSSKSNLICQAKLPMKLYTTGFEKDLNGHIYGEDWIYLTNDKEMARRKVVFRNVYLIKEGITLDNNFDAFFTRLKTLPKEFIISNFEFELTISPLSKIREFNSYTDLVKALNEFDDNERWYKFSLYNKLLRICKNNKNNFAISFKEPVLMLANATLTGGRFVNPMNKDSANLYSQPQISAPTIIPPNLTSESRCTLYTAKSDINIEADNINVGNGNNVGINIGIEEGLKKYECLLLEPCLKSFELMLGGNFVGKLNSEEKVNLQMPISLSQLLSYELNSNFSLDLFNPSLTNEECKSYEDRNFSASDIRRIIPDIDDIYLRFKKHYESFDESKYAELL